MNISNNLASNLIFHSQETVCKGEGSLEKTVHIWKCKEEILAEIEVEPKSRNFKFLSIHLEDMSLLPELTKQVTQGVRKALDYQQGEKLPCDSMKPLFLQCAPDSPHLKTQIMSWLKNGGDPNLTMVIGGSPFSMITKCIDFEDTEVLECFLEHGANPSHIYCSSSDYTTSLAYLAAQANRKDVLEELTKRDIELNSPLVIVNNSPSTQNLPKNPLEAAVGGGHLESAKFLLENDLNLDQVNEELLMSAVHTGNAEIVHLVLTAHAKKSNTLTPSLDFAKNLIKNIEFHKSLGHRFGIQLGSINVGDGYVLPESTEGSLKSSNGNINIKDSLKESVNAFFKNKPELSTPAFEKLLIPFFNTPLKLDKSASSLIKSFQNKEVVIFEGDWPGHSVHFMLFGDLLFVFNRGAFREDTADAGIQIYSFEDPSKFTEEMLLEIQSSPNLLLHPASRKELGLEEERFASIKQKEQPGGFCRWNNTKLCFKFLFALAQLPEDFEGDKNELVNALAEGLEQTKDTYKLWSHFDRTRSIDEAIQFYETHPQVKPNIPLLLFALANQKGATKQIISFLQKQKLSLDDFLICDNEGKTLFDYLSNPINVQALKMVAGEQWEKLISSVSNQKNELHTPVSKGIEKKKMAVVASLVKSGMPLTEFNKIYISLQTAQDDNPSYLIPFLARGIDLSCHDENGETGLHYAITEYANEVVAFMTDEMSKSFFKSDEDFEMYINYAQEEGNQEAEYLLIEAHNSWKRGESNVL